MEFEVQAKVIKILNMFRSDNEGEMLNACRALRILVAKHSINWENELKIASTSKISLEVLKSSLSKAAQINNDVAFNFFHSLLTQLEKRGKLSDKQEKAFFKFYENLK